MFFFVEKLALCFVLLTPFSSIDYVSAGESVLWHARSHHNSKLYEETLEKKLPSCDALRQIYGGG